MSFRASNDAWSGAARSRSPLSVVCLALATLAVTACGDEQSDPLAPASDPLSPAAMSAARATPGAAFDWSVPARFGEVNAAGLVKYPTEEEIARTTWPVDLDACALPGDEYAWFVDRKPVARVDECEYRHQFDAEGSYDVALRVKSADGSDVWAEEVVTVQDWLIVSVGDSYASGEGAPEVRSGLDAVRTQILDALQSLREIRQALEDARTNLEAAVENKRQADAILRDAQSELAALLNACTTIDSGTCRHYLLTSGLLTFTAADIHLRRAITNAEDRVASAQAAIADLEHAIAEAENAREEIRAAIRAAQENRTQPLWQPNYDVEVVQEHAFECHRSALAAPARAALALEEADPRTSVTFVHLACSGSEMRGGRASLSAQIRWANQLIGEREIDAVLVSMGGNDVGFSAIAKLCALQEPCYEDFPGTSPSEIAAACEPLALLDGAQQDCVDYFSEALPQSAKQVLEDGLDILPTEYAHIAETSLPRLSGLLGPRSGGERVRGNRHPVRDETGPGRDGPLRTERVYLVEYSDLTKDDNGDYCSGSAPAHDPFAAMTGFSVPEMKWLDEDVLDAINAAGTAAAAKHGWSYVEGAYARFASHGYCAQGHWMVRLHESLFAQNDFDGTGHPNDEGNAVTGTVIHEALMGDLYDGGIEAPRSPDGPPVKVIPGAGRGRGR